MEPACCGADLPAGPLCRRQVRAVPCVQGAVGPRLLLHSMRDAIDDSTPEGEFEYVTTGWAAIFVLEWFLQ